MRDAEPSPQDIARVVDAIKARMEQLGLTYANVTAGGSPSRITVRALMEQGKWIGRRDVRSKFSLNLGWQPDGLDRIARGEEPVDRDARPSEAEEISRLAEIQAGQTEEIRGLREQIEGLEGILRSLLRAVESPGSLRRGRGRRPPPPPES